MRGRRFATWLGTAAVLLAAAPARASDWPTYGSSVSRSGFRAGEAKLRPANARSLTRLWSVRLGGQINAQPLVASGLRLGPQRRADVVLAGNEQGRFVAVNAANGHVIWSRRLHAVHTNCADLPSYGITGTPQLDRARGSVYVGTGGRVLDLDLVSGATKRAWKITGEPRLEHNWSALTLSNGVLYAALAGVCDHFPFRGRLVAIDTVSGAVAGTWYPTGPDGPYGGGIWSFGGVSVDAAGDLYTATGNSTGGSQFVGHAEHVVRLDPQLGVVASHHPSVRGIDADFGATPLPYDAPGCPPQLAVGNKYGGFFVYDRDRIGDGPVQRIRLGGGSAGQQALLGVAAWWPRKRMVYIANPRRRRGFRAGMVAFRVRGDCRLSKAWVHGGPALLASSPTIAHGVLYYATGADGKLRVLSARTGKRLRMLDLHGPAFTPPAVVDGVIYTGSWSGRLYAFGRVA